MKKHPILLSLWLLLPIALLVTIVLPAYLSYRIDECRSICLNNLRLIGRAKETRAHAKGLTKGGTVSQEELVPLIEGGWPRCPRGGTYIINAIGQGPSCTYSGTPGGKQGDNHTVLSNYWEQVHNPPSQGTLEDSRP